MIKENNEVFKSVLEGLKQAIKYEKGEFSTVKMTVRKSDKKTKSLK